MVNPFLHLKAGTKYLFSLAKSEWTLTDYPIRFRHFNGSNIEASQRRLKPIPWSAQIINWWQMDGGGDTKEQAYADLEAKFNKFKSGGKTLPRPGTGLPIEFAATDHVRLFDDIADDFFRRVLDMNYRECFISDESSLWDFHTEESNEHFHKKVWDAYRVDVSDIEDGNLVKIFERIENRPSQT
jgi:hypothetical protein